MTLALDRIDSIGSGLNRPECVLCHSSGLLFASDWSDGGGVSIVHADGRVDRLLARHDFELRPNGIALEQSGNFLLAHLGQESGGVFRLYPDGRIETLLSAVDGHELPPTNFVCCDAEQRIWITVSTRTRPRADAYRADVNSGFIVLLDHDGARIVADDLGYTNECVISPDGRTLFVNETFGRRLSAFDIKSDGALTARRTVAQFGAGTFPDGLCLSEDGSLWISSIVSNRILRVYPDGRIETLVEDAQAGELEQAESAYLDGKLGRIHLDQVHSRKLQNISSLAFGGARMSTGYMGCLLGDCIYQMPMPIAGIEPQHWQADISLLLQSFQ